MISLKCLNMSEPCRIKYINLRMAISAVEVCGIFPTSAFFYQYPMWDEVQRCGSEHRLWSQGPEAKSQVGCVLAVHTWTPGQDFLCVCALQHTTLGSLWEWKRVRVRMERGEHSAWHRASAQWMKGNCRHRHHGIIFTPNCLDNSTRSHLASGLIELLNRFGTQTHPSQLSESGFFLIMFQK